MKMQKSVIVIIQENKGVLHIAYVSMSITLS